MSDIDHHNEAIELAIIDIGNAQVAYGGALKDVERAKLQLELAQRTLVKLKETAPVDTPTHPGKPAYEYTLTFVDGEHEYVNADGDRTVQESHDAETWIELYTGTHDNPHPVARFRHVTLRGFARERADEDA